MNFDAIVIGSGISGGWAAKELTEKGLKTILLERGREVKHGQDYPSALLKPWEFPNRLQTTREDREDNPVQHGFYDEGSKAFFIKDKDYPYIQKKPFLWAQGNQVGGRSLTWGRQCYRWSDLDFEANAKDGNGVDWPIRYRDLARWYDYVEQFIGVSGKKENLPHLPDGCFQDPMQLNCIEEHLKQSIDNNFDQRLLTIARVANLTQPIGNRGKCLNRNLCSRGCPFGAYFSSNSATIPAAYQTGNLTLRPFSTVLEIIFDDVTQKAKGVRGIDTETMQPFEFYAKIIFVNASTIASTALLLNSTSSRFPDGMGNDSGELGHNLMDHHSSAGAWGEHDGFKEFYYKGRRPCGFLIPRFRNLQDNESLSYKRGYNIQGDGERAGWHEALNAAPDDFGASFKQQLIHPGPWSVWMAGWGECLPYHDNKISLSDQKNKWGMPLVAISFEFKENEQKMMEDIQSTCADMLDKAGFKNVAPFNYHRPGGGTVHEMGTARMGRDPKTSVLNRNNQLHAVKNVFVTDGSCMTSSACQNPSLTYMALTARACQFAFDELKKGNL
ncbi:GMC oxidoreductase [Niabella insulamsoli]|uniref:GMC family oxidoreductase n=1 Tax=Niabella insulamsoli TaxID=3144874 RepID=UPI0031FCF6D7